MTAYEIYAKTGKLTEVVKAFDLGKNTSKAYQLISISSPDYNPKKPMNKEEIALLLGAGLTKLAVALRLNISFNRVHVVKARYVDRGGKQGEEYRKQLATARNALTNAYSHYSCFEAFHGRKPKPFEEWLMEEL